MSRSSLSVALATETSFFENAGSVTSSASPAPTRHGDVRQKQRVRCRGKCGEAILRENEWRQRVGGRGSAGSPCKIRNGVVISGRWVSSHSGHLLLHIVVAHWRSREKVSFDAVDGDETRRALFADES